MNEDLIYYQYTLLKVLSLLLTTFTKWNLILVKIEKKKKKEKAKVPK